MTAKEKLKKIDEACDLLNEAKEAIKKANKLFNSCGIETCGGFNADADGELSSINLQVYSGLIKMENITGEKIYYKDSSNCRVDKSRGYIKYKGLYFLMLAKVKNTYYNYYNFK